MGHQEHFFLEHMPAVFTSPESIVLSENDYYVKGDQNEKLDSSHVDIEMIPC